MNLLALMLYSLPLLGSSYAERPIRARVDLSAPEQLRPLIVKALNAEAQKLGDIALIWDSQSTDTTDCELHIVAVSIQPNSGSSTGVVIATVVTTAIRETAEDIISFAEMPEDARAAIRQSLAGVRNYRAMLVNGGTDRDIPKAIADLMKGLDSALFVHLRSTQGKAKQDQLTPVISPVRSTSSGSNP